MKIVIPDNISNKLGFSEEEFLLEIAIALFKEEKITLAQASELANLHQSKFQKELAKREITIHYGVEDLDNDMETLERLKAK